MANHPNRSTQKPSVEQIIRDLSAEVERRRNALPTSIEEEYDAEYGRLIEALNEAANAAAEFAPAFRKAGFANL